MISTVTLKLVPVKLATSWEIRWVWVVDFLVGFRRLD